MFLIQTFLTTYPGRSKHPIVTQAGGLFLQVGQDGPCILNKFLEPKSVH